MVQTPTSEMFTAKELAQRFGCTVRRINYAADEFHIEPTRRVGLTRMYDATAAEQIRSALKRIGGGRDGR